MAAAPRGMYQVAGLLLSASAVRYAGQLITLILIARFLGVDAVGTYTIALAICAPVYILLGFGMRTVCLTLQTPVATRSYERFLLGTLSVALAVIAVICILLPPQIAWVLLVVAAIRTGETFTDLYGALLQRAGRPATILAAMATGTGLQVGAVWAVLGTGGTLVGALTASCVVYLLNLLLYTRRTALRSARAEAHPRSATSEAPWIALFKAGLPTGVAIGMITLLSTVPQYLLAWDDQLAAAGRFAVFLYVVVAVEVLLHPLAQSWIPRARALRAAGSLTPAAVGAVGLRWTIITGGLGLTGLALAAGVLPVVLGPAFAITVPIAVPLAVAVILIPGVFAADTAIVVCNRYAVSMAVSGSALVAGAAAGVTLVALGSFDLITALWTCVATMAVRWVGGGVAFGRVGRSVPADPEHEMRLRRSAAPNWPALLRWWPLLPVFAVTAAAVAGGPVWSFGTATALLVLGLLCVLRLSAAELLVITAPLAFYVTAGGVLINLAVSDIFLLLLLIRVLADPDCARAFSAVTGTVRAALCILAFVLGLTAATTLIRSGLGAQVDWTAFVVDSVKVCVVITYFAVCLVVFRDVLARGDTRFLRVWALTAAGVGALGVVGSLLFAAGRQTNLTMDFRATGTFEDPNAFATYLILSLPLTMAARVLAGRSVLSWHLIPILAGIYASFSRGALVGLVAVLGMLFVVSLRDPQLRSLRLAVFVTVVVAVVFVAGGSAVSLFESSRGIGFGQDVRFRLWAAAVEVWIHSPVFGVGLGQFVSASADLLGPAGGVLAHNTYLSILAEGGLVGAGLYLAIPTLAVIGLLRAPGTVSGLLLSSGVGIAAMALSLNLQNFRPIWILLALALAWVSHRSPGQQPAVRATHRPADHVTARPRAQPADRSDSQMEDPWN